jgi:hypothetical protein
MNKQRQRILEAKQRRLNSLRAETTGVPSENIVEAPKTEEISNPKEQEQAAVKGLNVQPTVVKQTLPPFPVKKDLGVKSEKISEKNGASKKHKKHKKQLSPKEKINGHDA